ncbi:hypothetical protein ACQFYA_13985 [Promicromonospora sp. Marseille-Q5078]
MGLDRRAPRNGAASRIEQVPMRDTAADAPGEQRRGHTVTQPETPLPVRVWVVQRQTGAFEADGEATGWTDRQVHVRYLDPHGRQGYAWVWASAVTRRPAD